MNQQLNLRIQNEMSKLRDLTITERLLLTNILCLTGDDTELTSDYQALATRTGIARKTVGRNFRQLVGKRYLTKQKPHRCYEINTRKLLAILEDGVLPPIRATRGEYN